MRRVSAHWPPPPAIQNKSRRRRASPCRTARRGVRSRYRPEHRMPRLHGNRPGPSIAAWIVMKDMSNVSARRAISIGRPAAVSHRRQSSLVRAGVEQCVVARSSGRRGGRSPFVARSCRPKQFLGQQPDGVQARPLASAITDRCIDIVVAKFTRSVEVVMRTSMPGCAS